mgnify:CR=1 FL=1
MPVIIGINPSNRTKKKSRRKPAGKKAGAPANKKRKTAAKKAASTTRKAVSMARGRRKAKARRRSPSAPKVRYRTRTKEVVKYRMRNARPAKRVSSSRNKSDNVDIGKVIRTSTAVMFGMVFAKFSVNTVTQAGWTKGGQETDPWSWGNIAAAALSASLLAMLLRYTRVLKKQTAIMVAVGGIALALYKVITTQIAPKWQWTQDWLGQDEDIPSSLVAADNVNVYDTGDYGYLPGHEQYMGAAEPTLVPATQSGGQVVPFNPAMGQTQSGGQVVAYNPAMGTAPGSPQDVMGVGQRIAAAYPGSY